MSDHILFADCEGNNFIDDIDKMWCVQLGKGIDGEVVVYANHPDYPDLSEGLKIMRESEKVAFHNAMGFDFFAINKLFPNTLQREQIIDTLIISRLIDSTSMRHSLKELGSALGFPKGDHDDFSQFSHEMAVYGRKDVQILQKAWVGDKQRKVPSYGKFYEKYQTAVEMETQVAYLCEVQRQHGFRFDYKAAQELESTFRQEQMTLERQLQQVFPPITTQRFSEKRVDKITGKPIRLKDNIEVFNPGSRDQIAKRLITKYKWKPKKMTAGTNPKPKVDEDVLSSLEYPEAILCSEYIKAGKKLGQIADGDNAWLKLAKKNANGDYYLHGSINTLGARTHRMSHFKPNLAQVDSDHRLRSLFMADPGHKLVGTDAEGLELRMLAHYLHMYDNGFYSNVVHAGDKSLKTDIHSVNQRAAGLHSRDSAKTMIYAYLYGAGDTKLGQIFIDDCKSAGIEVPKKSLTALGKELKSKLERGVEGLGELISKAKRAHASHSALPGLDGRWIPNLSDHAALNTLLQGNGSIVMKKAFCVFADEIEHLQLWDKIGFCANVHDEYQISAEPPVAAKVAEVGEWSIMRAGELLEVRCPLVGASEIGMTWADTH